VDPDRTPRGTRSGCRGHRGRAERTGVGLLRRAAPRIRPDTSAERRAVGPDRRTARQALEATSGGVRAGVAEDEKREGDATGDPHRVSGRTARRPVVAREPACRRRDSGASGIAWLTRTGNGRQATGDWRSARTAR